jgi:helix-turn-helix protein
MSFQLMAWAAEQQTGSPTEKAVLLALANRANHDTGKCCPSVERIARETEFGTTAVKRALKSLCDKGIVSRRKTKRNDGTFGANYYAFPGGREATDQGREASAAPGTPPDPEPIRDLEPKREPPDGVSLGAESGNDDPPKLLMVDGRNLGFDALAKVCEIRSGSPREKEVAAALNGNASVGPGIRRLVWEHIVFVAFRETYLKLVAGEPVPGADLDHYRRRFEEIVATSIRTRAGLYRKRFAGAELTPTALAKWFLDVDPGTRVGGPEAPPVPPCSECGVSPPYHAADCSFAKPKEAIT